MFQNRRAVFLFVCSIVSIQALYYIVTLQIKKTQSTVIKTSVISPSNSNISSDGHPASVHNLNNATEVSRISSSGNNCLAKIVLDILK